MAPILKRLTPEQLQQARQLFAAGWKTVRVCSELGVSATIVNRHRSYGDLPQPERKPKGQTGR